MVKTINEIIVSEGIPYPKKSGSYRYLFTIITV